MAEWTINGKLSLNETSFIGGQYSRGKVELGDGGWGDARAIRRLTGNGSENEVIGMRCV